MTERRYISDTETAVLVRAALRESFPGIKFSVRCGRGSSSYLQVTWTDGPPAQTVRDVAGHFSGGYFDGGIDYAGSRYHHLDGERVHFMVDGMSCQRQESPAAREAIRGAWEHLPQPERVRLLAKLTGDQSGYTVTRANDPDGWHLVLHSWDFHGKPALPSPTMARVTFAGDDGYGAGTVGTPERPGGWQGYAQFERDKETT